jgi:hypothetical protein
MSMDISLKKEKRINFLVLGGSSLLKIMSMDISLEGSGSNFLGLGGSSLL